MVNSTLECARCEQNKISHSPSYYGELEIWIFSRQGKYSSSSPSYYGNFASHSVLGLLGENFATLFIPPHALSAAIARLSVTTRPIPSPRSVLEYLSNFQTTRSRIFQFPLVEIRPASFTSGIIGNANFRKLCKESSPVPQEVGLWGMNGESHLWLKVQISIPTVSAYSLVNLFYLNLGN